MRHAITVLAAAGVLLACSENPVGRKCYVGADVTSTQVTVASPAPECQSHLCLDVPLETELPEGGEHAPLCTGACEVDDDCQRVPESPCQSGFTCGIPTVVGNFCCQKLCICKDYLVMPDGGLPVPAACDPDNVDNTCRNLPGR